jgi:hypothetical protein
MVFLQNGKHRFTAAICNNTAWLNASMPAPKATLCSEAAPSRALWHRCLCQIGANCYKQAIKGKAATKPVVKSDTPAPSHCKPCIRGKHHRNLFPKRASHRTMSFLERVYSTCTSCPSCSRADSAIGCSSLATTRVTSGSTSSGRSPTRSMHLKTSRPRLRCSLISQSYACTTTRAVQSSASSEMCSLRNTAFGASTLSRCCFSRTALLNTSTAPSRSCLLPCSTAHACPHASGARASTICTT